MSFNNIRDLANKKIALVIQAGLSSKLLISYLELLLRKFEPSFRPIRSHRMNNCLVYIES